MADPPVTPDSNALTQEAIELQTKLTEAYSESSRAAFDYGSVVKRTEGFYGDFNKKLQEVGFSLKNLGQAASEHPKIFTAIGNAVIRAQSAFDGLNVDSSSITTFTSHLKDLEQMLMSGGKASAAAQQKINTFTEQLRKMPGGADLVAEAMKKGTAGILELMKNTAASADRAIAFQGSMMRSAAATGEFGKLVEKAGPGLKNLNVLMDNQTYQMNLASKATNSTQEQINRYYMSLSQVPGALKELVNSSGEGTRKIDMLTATIKLAHGTGRDYKEVVDDLHKSFTDYGVSGESALKFTARFSEIANKYGLELSEVRSGLMGATNAFKDMTNAGEGAAKMQENVAKFMDSYVQRLRDAGMTGKHAIETVQGITSAMGNLNIAQKAFLSAQTGGPGGLMGGFQIEKMIQQGDIEGLQKKFTQVMQKQFGKVVTLDDATKSQAAAAQLERQVMLLRQGPMGSVVKSDQDAYKFLDAMKAQQEGRPLSKGAVGLDATGLQKAIATGSTWEEKTHTVVSDMSNDVRAIRDRLTATSVETFQELFTSARTAKEGPVSRETEEARKVLKGSMADAQRAGGLHTQYLQHQAKTPGILHDNRIGMHTQESVKGVIDSSGNIVKAFKSGYSSIAGAADEMKNRIRSPKGPTPDIEGEIEGRRKAVQGNTPLPAAPAANPAGRQVGAATRRVVGENFSSLDPRNFGEAPRAGATVGTARRAPAPPRGATGAGEVPAAQPAVTVEQPSNSGRFKVHVTVTEDKSDNSKSIFPGPGT